MHEKILLEAPLCHREPTYSNKLIIGSGLHKRPAASNSSDLTSASVVENTARSSLSLSPPRSLNISHFQEPAVVRVLSFPNRHRQGSALNTSEIPKAPMSMKGSLGGSWPCYPLTTPYSIETHRESQNDQVGIFIFPKGPLVGAWHGMAWQGSRYRGHLLRQLSYAIKNQLGHPKTQQVIVTKLATG